MNYIATIVATVKEHGPLSGYSSRFTSNKSIAGLFIFAGSDAGGGWRQ